MSLLLFPIGQNPVAWPYLSARKMKTLASLVSKGKKKKGESSEPISFSSMSFLWII